MAADNSLAPSQRDSLLAYLQTPPGHIAAVNGPPGTGKTTLLQSVVATEMVARAVARLDAPLCIAAAATNQAVSNIIKAFREATEHLDDTLADRWIPGLGRRYGVYFRVSTGEGKTLARGSLVCSPADLTRHGEYDEEGIKRLIDDVERRNALGEEVPIDLLLPLGESSKVVERFLDTASERLGISVTTLEKCIEEIHCRLQAVHQKIKTYSDAADQFIRASRALGVDRCEDCAHAIRSLTQRTTGARVHFDALKEQIEIERAADGARERQERRIEAQRLFQYDSEQKKREFEFQLESRLRCKKSRRGFTRSPSQRPLSSR